MRTHGFVRWTATTAVAALAVLAPVVLPASASAAPGDGLIISEYVEGSSNNKAIEIYNTTAEPIDLTAAGVAIQLLFNGAATGGTTIALNGTVAAHRTFVLATASAHADVLAEADQTSTLAFFNGDDAVILKSPTGTLDVIGQVGVDPGAEWGTGLTSTQDNTLRRKSSLCAGRPDGSTAFDPATEWVGYMADDFTDLGAHATDTCGTDPGSGGGPTDPPPTQTCGAAFTAIPTIQGSGSATPLAGPVSTEGIVVGDHEGASPALRGFYLQATDGGDGDPATSDAIFVFNGTANNVSVGDKVRVTGTVGEFQEQTQISADIGGVLACGTGTVAPIDLTLPFASVDALERYEGMLVRFPQALTVTEHFQLGRFGQVTLSSGGRLRQPTNIVAPGPEALAMQEANNLNRIILDDSTQAQNPDPIVWARGGQPLSASNTVRGGDTTSGMTGVMTWTWGGNAASPNAWRVRPIGAMGGVATFEPVNPRPTSAPDVGGTTKVGGMNLLNYFNSFGTGAASTCRGGVAGPPMDCRGADNQTEFDRQTPKTVAAITTIDADVIGINEIENDGYGPDSAIQHLVDALNSSSGAGTWAFVDADAGTGQVDALGNDAIKVGMLYQPARVTPVGTTAVLNTPEFVNGGDTAARNRATLAQAFRSNANNSVFIANVNHLKSKGSACETPDLGDGQGNCSVVRTNSARLLAQWLATDPTETGDPDVLLIGDYNSYAKEKPIQALEEAGYSNQVTRFEGENSYSYVFDGQWGNLDHALASASMAGQVTGVHEFHINSDEPSVLDYNTNFKSAAQQVSLYAPDLYRVSDHDPVVIGLALAAPAPTVAVGGPYAVDEGGSVTLSATGSANDGGADPAYAWDLDGDGTFETEGASVTFSAATLDGPTTRTVKVRATNGSGVSAEAEATVEVRNVAPTAAASFTAAHVACTPAGATLSISASDPAAADTHTATVAWGDGTTETVALVGGSATVSHSYATSGRHAATVTVTDDDGGVSAAVTASTSVDYRVSDFSRPLRADRLVVVSRLQRVPVSVAVTNCDGSPVTGVQPTYRVTNSAGVPVASGSLTASGGRFSATLRPLFWWFGTYTVTVTVPETGQTTTARMFVL